MSNETVWVERCRILLAGNQIQSGKHRYTRPAPHVYEQQWLWDSCFHAITYRWFDVAMAQDELLSLLHHQVRAGDDAGMIPHMAYWQGGGAALWGADAHSIITQPPLIGVAARRVYERSGDTAFLRQVYPALRDYHAWFDRRRDPDGDHLVSLIHPWESGWDASPRWDAAMGLHHPTDDESKAARHNLVAVLREHGCDVRALQAAGAFTVEAVDFNAIRAADLISLGKIAAIIGEDGTPYTEKAAAVQQAVRGKLAGRDLFGADEQPLGVESAAQFVTLFGGCATPDEAAALVARLQSDAYFPAYPVPTTPTTDPAFDGGHYWRGNVWLAVNWLIYTGLRHYGYTELASQVVTRSLSLVEQTGFHEYFNPITGAGYGPAQQSWSAVVLDMLKTEST